VKRLFRVPDPASPTDTIQSRLLRLATLFLFGYSLALTFAPAARAHTWAVSYLWQHWIGFAIWLVAFNLAHQQTARRLPDRDPYLLPLAGMLSGWGLLTIWRLYPEFGARQTVWLALAALLLVAGLRLPGTLSFLRRYKYLWLTGALLLTAATFIFGTYPSGSGPQLWLGFGGIYLQPSEPLKLLLIAYLAAFLADSLAARIGLLQVVLPTLLMTASALLLLFAQRDLGTATLLIVLYAVMLYIGTGRKRILFAGLAFLLLAGVGGYLMFDVVRLRVEAWLNPWIDPLGRSYQIVQSLIAVAAGDVIGRGPWLGSPSVVPVAHSDFIFAAIAEETGLLGTAALIIILGLFSTRGIQAALRSAGAYQRYLATGVTAYLTAQSLLIIGGNLRLLPLTGVTLPFISYGGSSLLVSFACLLQLLLISDQSEREPAALPNPIPYLVVTNGLLIGLFAAFLINGWWAGWRSQALVDRADNPRWVVNDRFVQRGSLLDRNGKVLSQSEGAPGSLARVVTYPPLSPVIGYAKANFGLTALEASLDPYLRGTQGIPASTVWWHYLVYGQTPPGLDVRLSLSLELQSKADQLLDDHKGAAVVMNARTGEVLAMVSHPYFDANTLEQDWDALQNDPNARLLNRATQGQYPPGTVLGALLLGTATPAQLIAPALSDLTATFKGRLLNCALPARSELTLAQAVAIGCPRAQVNLSAQLSDEELVDLFSAFGLYTPQLLPLPSSSTLPPDFIADRNAYVLGQEDLLVNPTQVAAAASALTNGGLMPSPRLVIAVDTPSGGWVVLQNESTIGQPLRADQATQATSALAVTDLPGWQAVATALAGQNETVTWYIGGTLPNWQGAPIGLAVLLEEDNPALAQSIGQELLRAAQQP
jgi:cell division protein FtsW (lipid II flippase)